MVADEESMRNYSHVGMIYVGLVDSLHFYIVCPGVTIVGHHASAHALLWKTLPLNQEDGSGVVSKFIVPCVSLELQASTNCMHLAQSASMSPQPRRDTSEGTGYC